MNDYMDDFLTRCLDSVPYGAYRRRLEAELRDHLDSQCRALMESGLAPDAAQAEALRVMGEPEKLRAEYLEAWRRSWPGRLKASGYCLKTWGKGFAVMGGVHLLYVCVTAAMYNMAMALPWDSQDWWVRFIRGAAQDYRNSGLRHWLPLLLALLAGAYYLSYKFQASRHPAPLITVGLSFHWAYITAFIVWWQSIDDHYMLFSEGMWRQFFHMAPYNALIFSLCIFLGLVFGESVKSRRPAAA